MVKLHFFVCALLVTVLAERAGAQGSEIELLVVPSLTDMRGNSFTDEYSDATFHISAGIGYNYVLQNKFALKAMLLYDSKGADKSFSTEIRDANYNLIGIGETKFRNDFKYITLPLLFGRRFGKRVQFELAAGGYAGVLIGQQFEISSPRLHHSVDLTSNYRKLDFGVSGSASVYWPLGKQLSLKAGVLDNLGLADIADYDVDGGGTIKNNSLGLHVGLNIVLK